MTLEKPTEPLEARIYSLLLPHHSAPPQDQQIDDDSLTSLCLNLAFLTRHSRTGIAKENKVSPEDISLATHSAWFDSSNSALIIPSSSLVTQVRVFAHDSTGTWAVVKFEVQEGGDWMQALSMAVHEVVGTAFVEIGDGEGDGDGDGEWIFLVGNGRWDVEWMGGLLHMINYSTHMLFLGFMSWMVERKTDLRYDCIARLPLV
jgi:hypothetical protein